MGDFQRAGTFDTNLALEGIYSALLAMVFVVALGVTWSFQEQYNIFPHSCTSEVTIPPFHMQEQQLQVRGTCDAIGCG